MIYNAKIVKVFLGYEEDHRCFFYNITFEYSEGNQGTARCINFDNYKQIGKAVINTLEVIGCSNWCNLLGKFVRINTDEYKITHIGNILKDKWLDLGKMEITGELKND